MDLEVVFRSFERNPPRRRICLNANIYFDPWGYMGELAGCGGVVMVILLLFTYFVVPSSLWVPAVVFCILMGLALRFGLYWLKAVKHAKRLARYGDAVLGKITFYESVLENNDTVIWGRRVTVEYKFQTKSGDLLTGKRNTLSNCYDQLVQDEPIVVVYLPDRPQINEPYNSLLYCPLT